MKNVMIQRKEGLILASSEVRTRRKGIGGCSLKQGTVFGEQNLSNRRLEMIGERVNCSALWLRITLVVGSGRPTGLLQS